jgi:hypothetical protein
MGKSIIIYFKTKNNAMKKNIRKAYREKILG